MTATDSRFDVSQLSRLKDDIIVYEELLKDVITMFSSIMNLCIHSEMSITRLAKNLNNDFIRKEDQDSELFENTISKMKNQDNLSQSKNKDDSCNDKTMDLIRFTNTGPIFQFSKKILDSIEGSFIYEQRDEELRTDDGTIFLNYMGNDGYTYYLAQYLVGDQVYFEQLDYKDKLQLIDLFEFCELALPCDLVFARERRNRPTKVYYDDADNIHYDHDNDSYFIDMKCEYIKYINQYIENRCIDIKPDEYKSIEKDRLNYEMYTLFGKCGYYEVHKELNERIKVFTNSKIITNRYYENALLNWLGIETTWRLLFRASEHNYSAEEFHKYCDNKGETVTIITSVGQNNHVNIFGGYTDQSWESRTENCWKSYSKEFLFTLSNEHDISPTKYDFVSSNTEYGIGCNSSFGPRFGHGCDIAIYNHCHTNNRSYSHALSFAQVNTPQKNTLFVNYLDEKNQNHFVVDDYEVWGIGVG
ncbi:hypothetical protein WA158_003287 [Blastocystis sp. Blastoise]